MTIAKFIKGSSKVTSLLIVVAFSSSYAFAQDVVPIKFTFMPFQYAGVKGDAQKFRAINWINDGTSYGLKELELEKTINKDTHVEFEARSIPNDNDHAVDLTLHKENIGYLKTDYTSFRKYYDGSGGVYHPFTNYRVTTLEDDLKMDVEHFLFEVGTKSPDEPGVSVAFSRHAKDGRKSRLAWTAVKEAGVTRNIGPSWQDVTETTDTVTLTGNTELAGFNVSGEQKMQFFHASSLREEKNLTTISGLTSDNKMRRQWQEPQSDLFTTTFKGDKWFYNDKNHLSLAYRFSNMDNSELENINEYKADGTPFNYSNPKSAINASSNNRYNAHTTVGSFMTNLTKSLAFTTKFKSEILSRKASSTYPHDDTTNTPDGVINTTDVSNVESKIYRLGENVSLRYNGISKTTLYSEVDMEQTRNWLTEERDSIAGQSAASVAEQIGRETVTYVQKTAFTLGGRVVPSKSLSLTTQYRHKIDVNDYDDIFESTYNAGAKSAFIDSTQMNGNEATVKASWKPFSKIQGSVRYKFLSNLYTSRAENEDSQKSRLLSNIFSYDLNMNPVDPLYVTIGFSQDFSKVTTPVGKAASTQIPGFRSNSNTWLLSSSYQLSEKLNLNSSYQYSIIKNYNEYTTYTNYGTDNRRYDLTMGIGWNVNKSFSIEPHYSYYAYRTNQSADTGTYSAQVVWLDAKLEW